MSGFGFDSCPCCSRRDGLTSGGCIYCSARTYCACGMMVSCSCGHVVEAHACPCVTVIGTVEPIPTLPAVESWPP